MNLRLQGPRCALAVAGAAWIALAFAAGCRKTRTPIDYRVPADFSGGFAVIYEQPNAPVLPVVDGRLQVEIPTSTPAIIRTSSRQEFGFAKDRYLRGSTEFFPPSASYAANGIYRAGKMECVYALSVVSSSSTADAHRAAIDAALRKACDVPPPP